MDYKGIEYRVVRTIDRGWRWSFDHEGVGKSGISINRDAAALRVQREIDLALRKGLLQLLGRKSDA